jgi:uncharacterized membrane protein YtjA (UPF0391 family)
MVVKQRGWLRFLMVPLVAGALGLSTAVPVFADTYAPTNGSCNGSDQLVTVNGAQACQAAGTQTGQQSGKQNPKSCSIEKIGWFLCPLMESGAKAIDWTYNLLADRFLAVQPELFNNSSETKQIWEQARNLANIMFVIAFLLIVYSEITGGGDK